MHPGFLGLPTELRLHIYTVFLHDHQHVRRRHQPSNAHIRLLHTCTQIADEAGAHFRSYVSLLHEHQIQAFLLHADPSRCSQIEWADVANDGRVFQSAETDQDATPLSNLHLALARMTALRRLRVFQCRQGLPINLQNTMNLHRSRRLGLKFERAMFPNDASTPELTSYELFLNADTRVDLFDVISPATITTLRLSGELYASFPRHRPTKPEPPTAGQSQHDHQRQRLALPALRRVTLHSITGTYFDRHTIVQSFPSARLESFTYALGHRLGFEIRNAHLDSLARAHGAHLRTLVLLGCSRLSSAVITQALERLPALEHFALHMVTVDELRSDFVQALPPKLAVLMLQIVNAWYAVPLMEEERGLCESIESDVLRRERPYERVCVCFRDKLMVEGGRQDRWRSIAVERKFRLQIGPWEQEMTEEI